MVEYRQNVILYDDIYTLNLNKGNSSINSISQTTVKNFYGGTKSYPVKEAEFGSFPKVYTNSESTTVNKVGGFTETDTTLNLTATSALDLSGALVSTTLKGALAIGTYATIALTDGTGFRTVGGGTILVDNEIIVYRNRDGNNLTDCVRGAYGTTEAAHDSGATVKDVAFILIDNEIIMYTVNDTGNNILYNCVRGCGQTIATPHAHGTTVYSKNPYIFPDDTTPSIVVTSVTDWPREEGRILIGQEIIRYSDITGTTLSVTSQSDRGLDGSTVVGSSRLRLLELHFDRDPVFLVMYKNKRIALPETSYSRDAKLISNQFTMSGTFTDEDSGGMTGIEKKRIIERMQSKGGTIGFYWDAGYRSPYLVNISNFGATLNVGAKVWEYQLTLTEGVWKRTS